MNKQQKEERLTKLQAHHQALVKCHSEACKHEETHRRQSESILPDTGSYFPGNRASNMIAWSERRYHQSRWEVAKQTISRRMRRVKKKIAPGSTQSQRKTTENQSQQAMPNHINTLAEGQYITISVPNMGGNHFVWNNAEPGVGMSYQLVNNPHMAQPAPAPEPELALEGGQEDDQWDDDYDPDEEDGEDDQE